jgi:hypothetical protein
MPEKLSVPGDVRNRKVLRNETPQCITFEHFRREEIFEMIPISLLLCGTDIEGSKRVVRNRRCPYYNFFISLHFLCEKLQR